MRARMILLRQENRNFELLAEIVYHFGWSRTQKIIMI